MQFFKTIIRLTRGFIGLHKKIYSLSNLLAWDNLIATALIFVMFWTIGEIAGRFNILDPIGDAFADVEITDVLYSQLDKNNEYRGGTNNDGEYNVRPDSNIVIVNIGHLGRFEIARMLYAIQECKPKVTALDVWFGSAKPDERGTDFILADIFGADSNIVIVNRAYKTGKINDDDDDEDVSKFDTLFQPFELFALNTQTAPANMTIKGKKGSASTDVCRDFFTTINIQGEKVLPFPVKIAQLANPEAVSHLLARGNGMEKINYAGNIWVPGFDALYSDKNNYAPLSSKQFFRAFEFSDILDGNFSPEDFKDKIVLLGYLGDEIYVHAAEDKFFTPLNEKYVGKTSRDMYGVVVHANIIHTILNKNYINKMPEWTKHLTGILVVYLVIASFRPIYNDYKVWYDGLTKILGIILTFLIIFIIGTVFDYWNFEIKFGAIYFGCILLAGDFLEIYYGLLKNIVSHSK